MSPRVELLAPAGNPEAFYGAIHAGADAVYLAGNRFGARAYADNFTTEELVACIRYAHIWGRRVYLTVNTLVKEAEFDELAPYLTPFYEAGLDGVIVQDIGVFGFIREHFPDMELHVSTQMTLTGQYGAALLKKMGAVRVVPARELSLTELVEMKQQTGLEIETFIHGAMCYCYSGQCLFSSILGGRSGNRGRCAQPCRLPYQVETQTGKECYPLSLKDMCTIEHIPKLIDAGIDSFKIEGRMKKPEYAAGVTAIYRKYIDKYYAGEKYHVSQEDLEALGKLYIRSERQDGYYFRHNGKDMVTLESPSYSGADEELLSNIRNQYLTQKPAIKLRMKAVFRVGEAAAITLTHAQDDSLRVEVTGECVSPALKQPISEENIRKQLGKLGETLFVADKIQIELDDDAFYPLKAINDLRRQAVHQLEDLIIQSHGLCVGRNSVLPIQSIAQRKPSVFSKQDSRLHISVLTKEQLNAVVESFEFCQNKSVYNLPNRIYLDADFLHEAVVTSDTEVWNKCQYLVSHNTELAITLPPIIRKRDEQFLDLIWKLFKEHTDLFQGFLVRSMDGLGFLDQRGYGKSSSENIYGDAGLYVWNSQCARDMSSMHLNGFCIPYELKASEQRRLIEHLDADTARSVEKVIYGRIPLMLTANCIVNTTKGCDKKNGNTLCYLTDRYKKRFPVVRNCIHCMNTVYNSLPLSLHKEYSKWQKDVDFRLNFTIEDEQETARILKYFMTGAKGEIPIEEYTTGHEKRGAE